MKIQIDNSKLEEFKEELDNLFDGAQRILSEKEGDFRTTLEILIEDDMDETHIELLLIALEA